LELPPPETFWWHPGASAERLTHGSEPPTLTDILGCGHQNLTATTLDGTRPSIASAHMHESVDLSPSDIVRAHADRLTLPSATVYGALIDLMARLCEHGGGDGGNAGAASYGNDNEFHRPQEGSQDFQLLQLYEGNDNSLIDLPSCDTALNHGYRAFWAVGLLRLTRRLWPSASLHWRSLAALNDLITALARKLLGRVVEVVTWEL
ncbi:hypothetical protein Vretimale_11557, partial [Volvox reticuliferus]